MIVVLDTNIFLSALMVRGTPPDLLYQCWRQGRFDVASAEQQLEEMNRVSRRPYFQKRIRPSEIGRMINEIRRLAMICEPSRLVSVSPDPDDDFLLAVAGMAKAQFLVTGDKSDLLVLGHYGGTRMVTAKEMVLIL